MDIAFHASALFSPDYPNRYTAEERAKIEEHICSVTQLVQLEGGLDTNHTWCTAGTEMFATYLRSGNITPCISVQSPIIGNVYDNKLEMIGKPIRCPVRDAGCSCDVHFQENIVIGAEDEDNFAREKAGFVESLDVDLLRRRLQDTENKFTDARARIGQTQTADFESLSTSFVKQAFEANREFLHGGFTANDHPEFSKRQFPNRSSVDD